VAWALLDGAMLEPGESRRLHAIWFGRGDAAAQYDEFARHWGAAAGGRAATAAPFGWCSWYRFAETITPADVRAQLPMAARHGVQSVQIDDGWQAGIGDWRATSPVWRDQLAPVASEIRGAGLRAGIWTA